MPFCAPRGLVLVGSLAIAASFPITDSGVHLSGDSHCFAHKLVDAAPVLGLSGVAIFFNAYKTPLLWLGVVMYLIGILYLARKIRQVRQAVC